MPIYMVERVLPGATVESVEAMQRAVGKACRTSTVAGRSIRHLRSTFTPGESRCRCLFEAPDSDLVREVNDAADLPYSRIILAVEVDVSGPSADSSAGPR